MADGTHIEWTDATWNVINGCSVTSPGCKNCYAMRLAGTRLRNHPSRAGLTVDSKAGPVWTGETRFNALALDQPLKWTRPRMIFANAHGDLFHETVHISVIASVFAVAIAAHHLRGHVIQFLTKRAARQRDVLNRPEFWEEVNAYAGMHVMERVDPLNRRSDDARATLEDYDPHNPPPGLWLGVSVEDQTRADERIPDLLATPAAVRWVSAEPLLGPVDLSSITLPTCTDKFDALVGMGWGVQPSRYGGGRLYHGATKQTLGKVDWVVAGGESGPGARPMHPDWARSLRDQCAASGVAFLFKQWGAWAPSPEGDRCVAYDDGRNMPNLEPSGSNGDGSCRIAMVGKKAAGRLLDGVQHDGYPAATPGAA